ncbi:hypothetical protein ACO0QE_002424 [Hanseniaspora vineae]
MFALKRAVKPSSCLRIVQSARFENTAAYTDALALLKTDLKKAMLAKDDVKKTTIRTLLSSIKNKEIDAKKKDFDEFMLVELYSKLINQRKESISEFLKNDRADLVGREESEMAIIKQYLEALPVASKEEVEKKIIDLLNKLKTDQKDLQLKDVFKLLDLKTLPTEWKTSSSIIRILCAIGTLLGDSMWKNNFHGTPFLLNSHAECLTNQTFENTWYVPAHGASVKLLARKEGFQPMQSAARKKKFITKRSVVWFNEPPHILPVLLPMHSNIGTERYANSENHLQRGELWNSLNKPYPAYAKVEDKKTTSDSTNQFLKETSNNNALHHSKKIDYVSKTAKQEWESRPEENLAFPEKRLIPLRYHISEFSTKRVVRVKTHQEIIPDEPYVEGFPVHRWSIEVCLLDADGNEVPANIFDKVVYHLHPTFVNPNRTLKKAPFKIEEQGWGGFEMSVSLFLLEKGGERKVKHDLHFLENDYNVEHTIQVPLNKPKLAQALLESGPVPATTGASSTTGDAAGSAAATGAAGAAAASSAPLTPAVGDKRKISTPEPKATKKAKTNGVQTAMKGSIDLEQLALGLTKLNEDDLVGIVQMVADNSTPEMNVKNNVEEGEFILDLYSLPESLLKSMLDYTKTHTAEL